MAQTEHMQISVTNDRYLYSFIIVIDQVQLSDAGLLTFIATNEHGHAEATIDLSVKG
jgi:hypothetical protein